MAKELLTKFGERVRAERVKQGISQEKLAEMANLHRNHIGLIERAEKNITLLNIDKIAKALRVPLKKLMDF